MSVNNDAVAWKLRVWICFKLKTLTLVDLLPSLRFWRGGGDCVRFPQSSLGILRVFQLTLFVSEQKPLKSYKGTQEGRFGLSSYSPSIFQKVLMLNFRGVNVSQQNCLSFFLQGWVK